MKRTATIKTEYRKSAHVNLKEFCYFAKENDFIEITEWTNGEGFDLLIETERMKTKIFQLTWGEWDAIVALGKKVEKMNCK